MPRMNRSEVDTGRPGPALGPVVNLGPGWTGLHPAHVSPRSDLHQLISVLPRGGSKSASSFAAQTRSKNSQPGPQAAGNRGATFANMALG